MSPVYKTRREFLAATCGATFDRPPDVPSPTGPPPTIDDVRQVIRANFPTLWSKVDLGMAVCATLLLEDTVNCAALILVGPPSCGKTTVIDILQGHRNTYRSDNFTPAAFVTQAANRSLDELAKIDMLPRIKHKVLLTPDLGATFRGKEDDLVKRFGVLTRVLDGRGYMTDSGAQGRRGYTGDYLFAWVGGTTPFTPLVWEVMNALGNRLFFCAFEGAEDETEDSLMADDLGPSYDRRRDACSTVVGRFLDHLVATTRVRGVKWSPEHDPESVRRWITRCAMLLARARSMHQDEPDHESARRARAVLTSIARGHALVHGRRQLTEEDLPCVMQVTLSSLPPRQAKAFKALAAMKALSRRALRDVLGLKDGRTVDKEVKRLVDHGIARWHGPTLQLTERFAWANSMELLGYLKNLHELDRV